MRKIFQYFLLVGIVLLQACASQSSFSSYWNPNGNKETFHEKEAIYYHAADQLSLKVFNDKEFVDIFLETNSPFTLRKIYNLGMSIWIDPAGKGANTLGIHYPLPSEFVFSNKQFQSYLKKFNRYEFQEELIDRFQEYEIIDSRSEERIKTSTLSLDETCTVQLKTSNQVLFSYHLRIPIEKIFFEGSKEKKDFSISIASVNEANEEYFSALSSKEYINKRLERLQAGTNQSPEELTEWSVNFTLANTQKQ